MTPNLHNGPPGHNLPDIHRLISQPGVHNIFPALLLMYPSSQRDICAHKHADRSLKSNCRLRQTCKPPVSRADKS